jgi:uncharacterized protein with GYD domain
MAQYLLQLSYTADSWKAQLKEPRNRIEAVTPVLEKLGGRFTAAYYAFGEWDLIAVTEFPDNASAAAASIAFSSGGAVKAIQMTPLMTIEEGMSALRKGAGASSVYVPQR